MPSSLRRGAEGRGRLYYGWVLVTALGVTETVSWGILYYAFTVFLQPMESELGWSRAALTGAFSLAVLVSGLAAVPVGQVLDRHGARVLMTVGSCAGTLLVLAWAVVDHLVVFYLIWLGIGVAMAAVLYDPAFAIVTVWFRRLRGRALMVVTLMAGLASTIFIPMAAWLSAALGWRGALLVLAAVLGLATIPPHALLLRRRPADLGLAPDGAPPVEHPIGGGAVQPAEQLAARTDSALPVARTGLPLLAVVRLPGFAWIAVAYALFSLASAGVSVHLVPYLTDRGMSLAAAAGATGLVGAMQLVGRLLFAPLERRLAPARLMVVVFLVQPLALAALMLVPGTAGVVAFVVLFGAGRGAATLSRATLVAGRYGAARYGSISGVLTLSSTAANAAAPLLVGIGYTALGAYGPMFWGMTGAAVAAAFAAAASGRTSVAVDVDVDVDQPKRPVM